MEDEYIAEQNNDVYIESVGVDDLPLSDLTFAGMRVCGTGLIMVIGCIVILRILRNA